MKSFSEILYGSSFGTNRKIVDKLHAYAIIEQALRQFQDFVDTGQDSELSPEDALLWHLINIASTAQQMAECLGLVEPQKKNDEVERLKEQVKQLKSIIKELTSKFINGRNETAPLQKGTKNYSVSFDEWWLRYFTTKLEELGLEE